MPWLTKTGPERGCLYLFAETFLQKSLTKKRLVVFGWGDKAWLVLPKPKT